MLLNGSPLYCSVELGEDADDELKSSSREDELFRTAGAAVVIPLEFQWGSSLINVLVDGSG